MKLSTSKESLTTQLQAAVRVASTHSAVQALTGVQLEAGDTSAELRATDLEAGLPVPLEAALTRAGTAVLPARLLLDVRRSLPDSALTLELRTPEQDI